MPAQSTKQANTAKLAAAVKTGKFPKSKAGDAVKSMAKMPMSKLKHFMHKEMRDAMTEKQKRRLLIGLRKLKEGYAGGGTTDIENADHLVSEIESNLHVIAKTFSTKDDFDSYVNQHRGIQFTPKEIQAVVGFKGAQPTQQDPFFVKYEKSDDFGTNQTVVVKKQKENNQFCWTAFANYQNADEDETPAGTGEPNAGEEVTVNDQIRIIKSIAFVNDSDGADILGDFLIELEL